MATTPALNPKERNMKITSFYPNPALKSKTWRKQHTLEIDRTGRCVCGREGSGKFNFWAYVTRKERRVKRGRRSRKRREGLESRNCTSNELRTGHPSGDCVIAIVFLAFLSYFLSPVLCSYLLFKSEYSVNLGKKKTLILENSLNLNCPNFFFFEILWFKIILSY